MPARLNERGEVLARTERQADSAIQRGIPVAAFTFAHGGPRIDAPPPLLGQHNDEILGELGFDRRKRA